MSATFRTFCLPSFSSIVTTSLVSFSSSLAALGSLLLSLLPRPSSPMSHESIVSLAGLGVTASDLIAGFNFRSSLSFPFTSTLEVARPDSSV